MDNGSSSDKSNFIDAAGTGQPSSTTEVYMSSQCVITPTSSSMPSSADAEVSKIMENKPNQDQTEEPVYDQQIDLSEKIVPIADISSAISSSTFHLFKDSDANFNTPSAKSEPKKVAEQSADARIRRSTRDIKRPKFDDELVESIQTVLIKSAPKRRQSNEKASIGGPVTTTNEPDEPVRRKKAVVKSEVAETNNQPVESTTTPEVETNSVKKKRTVKPKKVGGVKDGDQKDSFGPSSNRTDTLGVANLPAATVEALKRWTPEDDIALIAAVTHVADLQIVHGEMKFSKKYTLPEIEDRWYELLYDQQASGLARKRMEQMSKERIRAIQAKIPYSIEEEQIIRQIPSASAPPLQPMMEQLLEQHQGAFHHARTPKQLEEHWRELKFMGLLADQHGPSYNFADDNLSIIERTYDLGALVSTDPSDQLPMDVEERQFTRSVVINEREANSWQRVFVSAITGIPPTNANLCPESIGLLCGRSITFDIRKEKALIGRETKKHAVDVNLTLEGPTARISRKQAIFKLADNGDCILRNVGKRTIYVDGRALLQSEATKLENSALIEIALIRLNFMKNENYQRSPAGHHAQPILQQCSNTPAMGTPQ